MKIDIGRRFVEPEIRPCADPPIRLQRQARPRSNASMTGALESPATEAVRSPMKGKEWGRISVLNCKRLARARAPLSPMLCLAQISRSE
jgi:hypothetical protein